MSKIHSSESAGFFDSAQALLKKLCCREVFFTPEPNGPLIGYYSLGDAVKESWLVAVFRMVFNL